LAIQPRINNVQCFFIVGLFGLAGCGYVCKEGYKKEKEVFHVFYLEVNGMALTKQNRICF
jgi:hypothetical protein